MSGNPDKLDGWGQILEFLGVETRRTVLRRGYKVRYVLATGRVYAFKSELLAHDQAQGVIASDSLEQPQTSVSMSA